jgi:hypothetical protein
MKQIIWVALLLTFKVSIATEQVPDLLIIGSDTLKMYQSPLEFYKDFSDKVNETTNGEEYSSCYRGFIATWTIKNNVLYLTKVKYCTDYSNPNYISDTSNINNLTESLLKHKFNNGLMLVPGISGTYWCGKFDTVDLRYEKEYKLVVKNSKVKEFSLRMFNDCVYKAWSDTLFDFIYSRISWDSITILKDDFIYASIDIETDESGKITSYHQEGLEDKRLITEIEEIIKQVPCFKVNSYEGRAWTSIYFELYFDEENKRKYSH